MGVHCHPFFFAVTIYWGTNSLTPEFTRDPNARFSPGGIHLPATLCAFAAWAFVDLSFSNAARLVAYDLRLRPLPEGMDLWGSHDRAIRPRIALFVLLSIVGALSVGLMFYGLFRGDPTERTLLRWFASTTVVALWLAMFIANGRIQELGSQWRLRRLVAGLQQDLPRLLAEWPADGDLPYLGRFTVSDDTLVPNAFLEAFQNGPHYHAFEPVAMVDKLEDGGLHFTVLSRDVTSISYRPDDRPESLPDPPPGYTTTRVSPNWFINQIR